MFDKISVDLFVNFPDLSLNVNFYSGLAGLCTKAPERGEPNYLEN